MQELNTINYKTFLRKIIKDLNKWRDVYHVYVSKHSILLQCQFFPKSSVDLNSLDHILAGLFLVEIDKLILKSVEKYEEPRLAKTILSNKNKNGELYLISSLL